MKVVWPKWGCLDARLSAEAEAVACGYGCEPGDKQATDQLSVVGETAKEWVLDKGRGFVRCVYWTRDEKWQGG